MRLIDPTPKLNEPIRQPGALNGLVLATDLLEAALPNEYRVEIDGVDFTSYVHALDEREGWAVVLNVRNGCEYVLCTGRVVLKFR